MSALIDKGVSKLISRKLLVWVVATGLLWLDKVNSEQWVAIALAYVGTQAFIDAAVKWKGR